MSRVQEDQFVDYNEEECCPLCVEDFDLADKNFRPCPCGYHICQFCFNNIRTTMNGLCPACRLPYDESTIEFKNITPEEMARHKQQIARKAEKNAEWRQKEAQKAEADSLSRKYLAGLRVVQKNLVYVTGLTPTIREDRLLDTLRGNDYFGQYGKIIKIAVSKAKKNAQHQQSVGVYVTFARKEDAAACVAAVDGSQNGDRILRAQYGTTMYCSAYLRGEQCINRNCMFLHEPEGDNDSFTRQNLSTINSIRTQQDAQSSASHVDALISRTTPAKNAWALPPGTTAASVLFGAKDKSSGSQIVGSEEPSPRDQMVQHPYVETPLEVESSITMRRDDYQSSTTGRTYSTRPTTVSDPKSSKPPFNRVTIAQNRITEEAEFLLDRSEAIQGNLGDGQSTISADSMVVLSPSQRNLIIQKFSDALLKDLPSKCLYPQSQPSENLTFRQFFNGYIKDYSKEVMEGTTRRSRNRQASKAIRLLRNEILLRFQDAVGGLDLPERNRILPSITRQARDSGLREQTPKEKCGDWLFNSMIDCNHSNSSGFDNLRIPFIDDISMNWTLSDNSPDDISVSSSDLDRDEGSTIIEDPEDHDVYSYLVEHHAFSTLIRNLRRVVEQHLGNQMELIRHRVLLALRRPGMIEKATGGVFRASFRTEWDPLAFLEEQYPDGHRQPLRGVLALTGGAVNAQLTTVEHYLRQTWPERTYLLIDKISSTICQSGGVQLSLAPNVEFHPGRQTVSVSGSEDLIVSIAQQLAWLGAACRASIGQLATCYTALSEVNDPEVEFPGPVFHITYDISSTEVEASESCWHNLVGNSVIVAGFPIPERTNGEVGLHIPLELMSALAKIPLATRFCGGYVLKGRSIMLVPVERKGTSVQWHLIQKQGGSRMHFRDLHRLCPNRLQFDVFDEADLSSTNSFLGWCPESRNHLATKQFKYQSVRYSKTPLLSKRTLSIVGGSVGFQQLGTAGLNFTLGKKDGYYHNTTADFYQDLLDDAAQIHVILQDMEDRRGWLADAETMILHIILHRHALNSFKEVNEMICFQAANPDDPFSVRQAMISNADIVVRDDKHMSKANVTSKIFKDLVGELYTIFEGLVATQEEMASVAGLEVNFDQANHLIGWEYLDLVNRKLHPQPRRTLLRKTCGRWPKLMREINAVVLFGVRFHEAIQPTADIGLCSRLKLLPKEKDYLAMEVAKLQKLTLESGSSEQEELTQLTLSGTHLRRSKHLFEPCPVVPKGSNGLEGRCACERVQQIVFKKGNAKIGKIECLRSAGAIIIGKEPANWIGGFSLKKYAPLKSSRKSSHQDYPPLLKIPTSQLAPSQQDTSKPVRRASMQYSASSSSRCTERSGSSTGPVMSTGFTSTTSSAPPARRYRCYDRTPFEVAYSRQSHKQEPIKGNRKDQRELHRVMTPTPVHREMYNTLFSGVEMPPIERLIARRSRWSLDTERRRNTRQPNFGHFASPPLPSSANASALRKPMPQINQSPSTSLNADILSAAPNNRLLETAHERPTLRHKPNFVQVREM